MYENFEAKQGVALIEGGRIKRNANLQKYTSFKSL
jgi:hypothetical protein